SAVEPFAAVDVEAARAAVAGGPVPADPLTALIADMVRAPGNDPVSLLNVVAGFAEEPFDAAATPPTTPVLLVGGDADPMASGIDGLAAILPDARVLRVPGDHLAALRSAGLRQAASRFLLD
ncbi:MAG: hypothetical protein QM604_06600, partial [Microbacterium sp.]